jgi:hypothetical protein
VNVCPHPAGRYKRNGPAILADLVPARHPRDCHASIGDFLRGYVGAEGGGQIESFLPGASADSLDGAAAMTRWRVFSVTAEQSALAAEGV